MARAPLLQPVASRPMSAALEHARQQWEEGHRRLQSEARDAVRYERLLAQVEVVTAELRRRLGQTFTLAELVELYQGAEAWLLQALAESAPGPGWSRSLSTVQDAAFHLYARGARDYAP